MNHQFFKNKLDELSLIAVSIVVLMSKAYDSTLQAMDSSIHARLALEVTGNGWMPKLPMPNLHADSAAPFFNDHPYTLFFIVGKFMRAFGAEAWSARFIPSLFGLLSILLVKKIGDLFFSKRVGFFASLLLLFTPLFIQFTARFQLDPAMIFFILCSFYFWMKECSVLAGVTAGLAVAFKSPVGFLLFPAIILATALEGKWSFETLKRLVIAGLCSLAAPIMIWASANIISEQNLAWDYIHRQIFGTAVDGRGQGSAHDPLYFIHEVINRNAIWKFWILLGAFSLYRSGKKLVIQKSSTALIFSASIIVIAIISMMRFKFPHYYLPAFPFLAILFAVIIDPLFAKIESGTRTLVQGLAWLAPLALIVFPIHPAPEMFPAIKKFAAFIQSEGTAADRVLFIEHAEPYGTSGDYFVETIFYTGRKFLESKCDAANVVIEKEKPEWIMTSGGSVAECISQTLSKKYPFQLKLGNQYLLGIRSKNDAFLDLTPLYRELKAPIDGNAAPLPKDIQIKY